MKKKKHRLIYKEPLFTRYDTLFCILVNLHSCVRPYVATGLQMNLVSITPFVQLMFCLVTHWSVRLFVCRVFVVHGYKKLGIHLLEDSDILSTIQCVNGGEANYVKVQAQIGRAHV